MCVGAVPYVQNYNIRLNTTDRWVIALATRPFGSLSRIAMPDLHDIAFIGLVQSGSWHDTWLQCAVGWLCVIDGACVIAGNSRHR